MQIAKAKPAAWSGVNGVAHHRPAPMAVAVATPPTKPSTVLLGLTAGAILWRPRSLPQTYWKTSESWTTSTRKSRSLAPPAASPATGNMSSAGAWERQ